MKEAVEKHKRCGLNANNSRVGVFCKEWGASAKGAVKMQGAVQTQRWGQNAPADV